VTRDGSEQLSELIQDSSNADDADNEYAAAFGTDTDRLGPYSQEFHDLPDPFDYFIEKVLKNQDSISDETTYESYHRTYRQWRELMAATSDSRHPACPRKEHVKTFIRWQRDVHGNTRRTIKGKLRRLSKAYEYWQETELLPHPEDWNPFTLAKKEASLGENPDKEYHTLTLAEFRSEFSTITNIRRRAIVGTQSKEGIRAGEISNLKISEIHISHHDLQQCYPEMGTHPAIGEHQDVLYIPPERDGNKSSNPRLLPIDDELRFLLIRHLLSRPQVDEPWVFLSKRSFTQITPQGVNSVWKDEFHPKYAETDEHAAITSHFGRHWFSSFWRVEQGMDRELVQYMRGDRVQPIENFPDAIDDYLHPKYESIASTYRDNIFKFNIQLRHASLE
jgi:integrase/recombinase XerD